MNSNVNKFLFLLSCLFFISFSTSNELSILLKVKSFFDFTETIYPIFDTWSSYNSACNFSGIYCNSKNSVTQIDLSEKSLKGILSLDSICELPSIEKLNFGSNFLSGTISAALGNCTNLKYLDLSMNDFTGFVPDLSSLGNLSFLNLQAGGFSGVFQWKSLENLRNLQYLSLGDNSFETNLFPMEIVKLYKLRWINLGNCSLEGRIPPEIGNLTELINLELHYNQLSGPIPAELGNLKKLGRLNLYSNFLSGEIPEEFGQFKFLVQLALFNNMLTGSLPQSLGSLAEFEYIDASENNLTGPIPPDMCKKGKMTMLLILQNKLIGGIPESYANCLSMVRIRVNNNFLSGKVPGGLWGLPKLSFLDLSMNQFNGSVMSEIGKAKVLTQLRLRNNRFSGELPSEITKASSLELIDVSSNQFFGTIPTSIRNLEKLNALLLQDNMFHGSIPESLRYCSNLMIINFAGNMVTGEIPASLGSLFSLNSLNLSDNQLSNRIPESLSSLKLSLLDLSNNRLSGPIPKSLSKGAYNGSFVGNSGLCSPAFPYLRPCSSDSGVSLSNQSTFKSNHRQGGLSTGVIVLIGVFAGVGVLLLVVLLIYRRIFFSLYSLLTSHWRNNIKISSNVEMFLESCGNLPLQRYKYSDIKKMTNSFQETLGQGGYGSVFKGKLKHDGRLVAVKLLNESKGNGEDFINEVSTIGRTNHVNVVSLLGYCTEKTKRALVYEFMPNGSLERFIYNEKTSSTPLGWEKLYQIALGIARGLEYLHRGCNMRILHFDIKPHNILLDQEFCPKISDFGLAKLCPTRESVVSMLVARGTIGYIAPEVYCRNFGGVSHKSDIYSYGMMVLEIIGGRKNIDATVENISEIYYPQWIYNHLNQDINVEGCGDIFEDETTKKMIIVALWCIQTQPTDRPSISKVVEMLEGSTEELQMPPNPFQNPPSRSSS